MGSLKQTDRSGPHSADTWSMPMRPVAVVRQRKPCELVRLLRMPTLPRTVHVGGGMGTKIGTMRAADIKKLPSAGFGRHTLTEWIIGGESPTVETYVGPTE